MVKSININNSRIDKLNIVENYRLVTEKSAKSSDREQGQIRKIVKSRSFREKFATYTGESINCLQVILKLKGSVLRGILPCIALCGIYALLVSGADRAGYLSSISELKALPNAIITLNIILSLLLAFRTNTAHQRFWEGRKLWGAMVNTVRNLTRSIWIYIEECDRKDRYEKEAAVRLATAFPIAMKLHLRRESVNSELAPFVTPWQYQRLQYANHPTLEIAFWVGDYLQEQYDRERVNVIQLALLQEQLNEMVNILGGCERILKTPVPLAYTIALKILFMVYFLVLPLGLVQGLHWWTVPATIFISFLVFSIHEIGCEIEEPFGRDPNDLPLDFICNTIVCNVKDLLIFEPSHRIPFSTRVRNAKNYLSGKSWRLMPFVRGRISDLKKHLNFNDRY
ncbi:MAG: bestrophin family ion channel [Prochloraceae cyanobacterium]|nr:bestrophin family ion channel [Prochloraceae cyanobacterium]